MYEHPRPECVNSSEEVEPEQPRGNPKKKWSRRELGTILLGLGMARMALRPAHAESDWTVFAIVGDYGRNTTAERDVANLIKSWNPEFIVTNGDNNYGDSNNAEGSAVTIDKNVGQYYHEFIYPYKGTYGAGADVNRFFPILADKDYNPTAHYTPYLDYFTLPGQQRYYDFVWGPVHFFMVNSDTHEPDGTVHPSVQSAWLQAQLEASTAPWKVVHIHHPPYASYTPSTRTQWPFAEWGADVVSSGERHVYERIHRDGIVYFVNGLGGRSLASFLDPVEGSVVRYAGDYGAQRVTATADSLTFEFFTRAGVLIDSYTLEKDPLALPAPSALIATAVSASQIDVAWSDNTEVVSGFEIERSLDGRDFAPLAAVGPEQTTYSDTGLSSETRYHYRVRAFDDSRTSRFSTPASATTHLAAPTNFTATPTSTTKIQLVWQDNSTGEQGFEIERSTDGENFTLIKKVSANVTGYLNSSLVSGTTYYYRLRAYNASGKSAYSDVVSAIPMSVGPAGPSALTAIATSESKTQLTWQDNSTNESGFEIERSTDGENFTLIKKVSANVTGYLNSSLVSGTTYYYRLRAYNASGKSAYSDVVSATTKAGKPAAPSGLSATAVSSSQIDLTWTDNSNNESGFKVYRSLDGVSFSTAKSLGPDVTSYSDTGRTPGTQYYYQVRAYNAVGNSAASNTTSATTLA